jgi:zinc/manganese transport system permease protein
LSILPSCAVRWPVVWPCRWSSGPIGLFLVMRRMSLMGDAMSHAVLPGAAVGFMLAGLSLPAMSLGGFVAGVLVAVLAGSPRALPVSRKTPVCAFYLLCLAIGVLLVSKSGSNVDLMHILFGSVLAVDDAALYLVGGVASVTLITLAFIYRPMLLESLDPSSCARWVPAVGCGIWLS